MLHNYLTIAWRSLKNQWQLTSINILGLAIGIAAFLLILHYSLKELTYDVFHGDADDIYRVSMLISLENRTPYHTAATYSLVGPGLTEEFSQVDKFCRMVPMGFGNGGYIQHEDYKEQIEEVLYVDSSFFDVFSFKLVSGNPTTVLTGANKIVISEELALRYFKGTGAVGEVLKINSMDGPTNFTVTGVFEKRDDSHLNADILVSFASLVNLIGTENAYSWNWFDYITYIKLKPGSDIETLTQQFVPFIDKHGGERRGSNVIQFQLQPIKDIHLRSNLNQELSSNGDQYSILFLIIVAGVILLSAWINYINLYISQATERIKEVGIRKTLGSSRNQLKTQFFVESAIVNLVAIFLAVIVLWLVIPYFNSLANAQISFFEILEYNFILSLILLWSLCTLVTGVYPAIILSGFETLKSLKQKGGNSSTGRFRKALVIFQFTATSGLVSWTLLVYGQYSFMNNKNLGIETSQTLVIETPDLHRNSSDHTRRLRLLGNQIGSISNGAITSLTSDIPGSQVGWRGSTSRLGAESAGNRAICYKMVVDNNYLPMLEAKIIAGRNFVELADSTRLIINEKALDLYEFHSAEEAIGQRVSFAAMGTFEIIGVVRNYFQESLKEDFKPTAYFNISSEIAKVMINFEQEATEGDIKYVQEWFAEIFPELPFNYYWLDDHLNLRHQKESSFYQIFKTFTFLTLFISFVGLVSLSYYIVKKRLKEIGIRKVLGSSRASVLTLIFKDVLLLVVIGNVVSLPFFSYFGQNWLAGFAFHTDLNWGIILITLLMTIAFAATSTLYHVLRGTSVNPIKVLRSE